MTLLDDATTPPMLLLWGYFAYFIVTIAYELEAATAPLVANACVVAVVVGVALNASAMGAEDLAAYARAWRGGGWATERRRGPAKLSSSSTRWSSASDDRHGSRGANFLSSLWAILRPCLNCAAGYETHARSSECGRRRKRGSPVACALCDTVLCVCVCV